MMGKQANTDGELPPTMPHALHDGRLIDRGNRSGDHGARGPASAAPPAVQPEPRGSDADEMEAEVLTVRPIAAVIAVVIRHGQVLLVRRRNPPDAGRWGFPGGKIEFGETIAAAAMRELLEETGLRGEAHHAFTAVDAFDSDAAGGTRAHFILVAVLCRWIAGEPVGGDDALEACWFDLSTLTKASLAMSVGVVEVARQAARIVTDGPWEPPPAAVG